LDKQHRENFIPAIKLRNSLQDYTHIHTHTHTHDEVTSRYIPVKEKEMDRACRTHGEKRNSHRIFVGKPEGK
jgi:hypothetical protein